MTGEGEDKAGIFTMRNGKSVTVKRTGLDEESAKRLDAWKPVVKEKPSVFDEVLDGNQVILDDKKFKKHEPKSKPAKYYVFYYTASWCGPCKAFTPELVKFYNEHKSGNFEIVLISSDHDEKAMEAYAEKNKMPWPQLKFSQIGKFEGKFNHGVKGIPAVIVCDLEGKIVTNNGRDLEALEKLFK
ncbi:MAG: thioredoxin-like domain-containing protein [Verrucomicrobiota bacterium]